MLWAKSIGSDHSLNADDLHPPIVQVASTGDGDVALVAGGQRVRRNRLILPGEGLAVEKGSIAEYDSGCSEAHSLGEGCLR